MKEIQRRHPHGRLAAHVLGDVNIDSEGIEGIEMWFNKDLKGKLVPIKAVRDALGRPAFMDADAARSGTPGKDIRLTIDSGLQFAAERELALTVSETKSVGGTVIVMNADNGEILAMANEPSFHPDMKRFLPSVEEIELSLTDMNQVQPLRPYCLRPP